MDSQVVVEPAELGVLVSNPLICSHSVAMAAFDHEWPRRYEARHFGIVEGLAEIKFGHFILTAKHIAKRRIDRDVFADPFVKIGRANGKGITLEQRRHAHGGFAAVR